MTLVGPSLLKGEEPEAGATLGAQHAGSTLALALGSPGPDPSSKTKPGRVLENEGVRLVRATADAVALVPDSSGGAHKLVCIAAGGAVVEVEGDTLLVATGRRYLPLLLLTRHSNLTRNTPALLVKP